MHLSSDMGRECCVCLVWHRICLIPFSVSVALSESFLWSVNLNVIAWPNHYKSGFVRIFSYKAGAVQGYLLYSFTEELIEVNLPLSSQNAPRGTGFVLVCSFLGGGSAILLSWVAAQPSLCLPEASLCFERVPDLAGGTSGTSAAAQGHSNSSSSLCDLSLHLSFYTVVFQMEKCFCTLPVVQKVSGFPCKWHEGAWNIFWVWGKKRCIGLFF